MPQMQKNKVFTLTVASTTAASLNLNRRNMGFNMSQTFDHHQIQVYATNTSNALVAGTIDLTFRPVGSEVFAEIAGSTDLDNGDVFLVDIGPWEEIKVSIKSTHGLGAVTDGVTIICNSFVAFGGMGQ